MEHDHNGEHHVHQWDEESYGKIEKHRLEIVDIRSVLDFIQLKKSETVIDVGSGDGFYSILFSEHCNNVVSLDMSGDGINLERKKLTEKGIKNVTALRLNVCETPDLPLGDRIFFSTSFHDFPCKEELISKFSNGMIPKFTLIEFHKNSSVGPPSEIKLSPEELNRIFHDKGYERTKFQSFDEIYMATYEHMKSK